MPDANEESEPWNTAKYFANEYGPDPIHKDKVAGGEPGIQRISKNICFLMH